ncbi:hypothetical protein B0I35DRAFT_515695 [Stachybotrys elegans]|uniref:PKS/mFAS DH domain-containing protein n=1 Tax=Stachybotrys elegans TaxID=80388 RepID=A0A8K0WLW3_9HYPO|nr:hypothetical protein B0I35DRAFT_515695 [Stachybotrys elegans]
MHPTVIDGCLQIATVALNRGHHSAINTLMPPAIIDNLVIFPQDRANARGIVASEAMWSGVGRPDDNKRYVSDMRTFAEESGDIIFHLQGLRYHAINATSDKPHAFTQVFWSQDIDFLTPEQLSVILGEASTAEKTEDIAAARIAKLASLIAHKRPSSKILDIALKEELDQDTSLWIDSVRARAGQIASGCKFRLSSPTANASLKMREKCSLDSSNIEFSVHDGLTWGESDEKSDLIIMRTLSHTNILSKAFGAVHNALAPGGYVFIVQESGPEQNGTSGAESHVQSEELSIVPDIATTSTSSLPIIAGRIQKAAAPSDGKVHSVWFGSDSAEHGPAIDYLLQAGYKIEKSRTTEEIPEKATVIVLDEMYHPIVPHLQDEQFASLRQLLDKECRLLWVTKGSQMQVTNPELGLMFGASRSLLAEYPSNQMMVLDVSSSTDELSFRAIGKAIDHLNAAVSLAREDSEFVERNGMYYVSRVVADDAINTCEREMAEGAPIREEAISNSTSTIRLISERVGTLDTLMYNEIDDLPSLNDDEVEIDVKAAGMNFKDLANAMGFLPANEHLFGLECAGTVREVGMDMTTVSPGGRVFMVRRDGGCFANRVRNRWQAAYKLPDNISFAEGSTLGIAPHTAVYALVTLANVQVGQTVLIHSGSGGVGLAAIDLCHHLGAEIYVTVGTEAKRDFLADNYGISRDRMFDSRSTSFAAELMKATGGRGVDVCLNSLTGDMLHESWRLSMGPFDRNCSYRALDLSRKSISDDMTRKTGEYILDLVKIGRLKPLYICKVFPYEETVEAFRYMQRGKHIGKVVISYEHADTTKVPMRPAPPRIELRGDGSYLIAGGFKGLCGSLAVYLARQGAKNITVISRSGHGDEKSQKTIYDCTTLGCNVDCVQRDICNVEDVRRAFKTSSKPVIGVIQGAMYECTWNLHKVSLEQDTPFDFFTLLSSVSGLVGQLGQSNYAAGNVFLDSFAAYRLQQGLPANLINLGPIEDVGYLNDKEMLSRIFEARGWSTINEAQLHRILRASIMQQTQSINSKSTGQLITAIMPGSPPFEALHRFSTLRPAAGSGHGVSGGGGSANTKLAMLKDAAKGEVDQATLLAAAVEIINPVLMRSLGVGEKLDPARPLANYPFECGKAPSMYSTHIPLNLGQYAK